RRICAPRPRSTTDRSGDRHRARRRPGTDHRGSPPVSMDAVARTEMFRAMHARGDQQPVSWATARRIGGFTRPMRARLLASLSRSVGTAVRAVAPPVLAGRVGDAIVDGGPAGTVGVLAAIIAAIALGEAAVTRASRWLSATIGEQLIFRMRTA